MPEPFNCLSLLIELGIFFLYRDEVNQKFADCTFGRKLVVSHTRGSHVSSSSYDTHEAGGESHTLTRLQFRKIESQGVLSAESGCNDFSRIFLCRLFLRCKKKPLAVLKETYEKRPMEAVDPLPSLPPSPFTPSLSPNTLHTFPRISRSAFSEAQHSALDVELRRRGASRERSCYLCL